MPEITITVVGRNDTPRIDGIKWDVKLGEKTIFFGVDSSVLKECIYTAYFYSAPRPDIDRT